jgi:microcystin-dependent protein
MTYNVRYSDQINNPIPIVVDDNTVDGSTSIQFPGRNTTGYGQIIAESFLHLLENFASVNQPINPIPGQLWYDTNVGIKQLFIYDGVSWVAAGGLKKGGSEPLVSSSLPGDLFVNTDTQQLFLFTGSAWTLIGPQLSSGEKTGAIPETITDRNGNEQSVVVQYASGEKIAIISKETFRPKVVITGFPEIYAGVTLNSNFNGYFGTAEKTQKLIVTGYPLGLDANNFLRGDVPTTANRGISIKSKEGLTVGDDGQLQLFVDGARSVIYQKTSGSNLDMRVNNNGQIKTVVTVDSSERVGINNSGPLETLDVIGNIVIRAELLNPSATGLLRVSGIADTVSSNTGSLVVDGGVGIGKSLNVGIDVTVGGTIKVATAVVPDAINSTTLGTPTNRFENVYAKTVGNLSPTPTEFIGNLTGTVRGSVNGSATRLASATVFEITGDITSNEIAFDGQTNVSPVQTVSASGDGTLATLVFASAWLSNITYASGIVVTHLGITYTSIAGNNLGNTPSTISSFWTVVEVAPFPAGSEVIVTSITPAAYRGTYTVVTGTKTFITYSSNATGSQVNAGTIAPSGVSGNRKRFISTLSETFITEKEEVSDVSDFKEGDEFLLSQGTAGLKRIKKSVIWQAISQTPIGAVTAYAGLKPPKGWLLCDGAEVSEEEYNALFQVVGYSYGNPLVPWHPVNNPFGLRGNKTFRLPDLRGRFALGADNMNNNILVKQKADLAADPIATIESTAGRVNDPRARINPDDPVDVRIGSGAQEVTLTVNNIPDHEHDLKGPGTGASSRFYLYREGESDTAGAIPAKGLSDTGTGQFYGTSGGILTNPEGGPFSQAVNIMNPFMAMNYIIYAGGDI